MADSIPPQNWYLLIDRLFERYHLGGTFNNEKEYRRRFKIVEQGEKFRKKLILQDPDLSDKWKSKAIHLIDNELKDIKNLNAEGNTGVTITDRLWRDAHADPDSRMGLTLRFGAKRAKEVILERVVREQGELVPIKRPSQLREKYITSPQAGAGQQYIPRRWTVSSNYYKRMRDERKRLREERARRQ